MNVKKKEKKPSQNFVKTSCPQVPCIQTWRTCQFSVHEIPCRHRLWFLLGLTLEANSGTRDALKAGLPVFMVNLQVQAQAGGNTFPLGNAGPLCLRMQGKSACSQVCVAKCPAKHALGASRLLYAELGWLSWEFASPESPTSIWVSEEALECPCLFLHTREPAVPVQSSSQYPAFLPGQSHQVACPKQLSWGFLTWLPGLISSSVSRPVS